mgnify:CR=1 FL=1
MAISFNQIRTYIYDWVIANVPVGMPAIMLYSNAPRPTVDYLTILISSVVQIGWDWEQNPLMDDGVSEQVGDREFTVQIQGYGGDPISVLQNLRTSLQKQSVLDSLRANGIVFANWFPINDITELVDSRFEQRASMDILFRIADIYTEDTGVIETVELEEIFKDPSGTVIYDEIFEIPPS